jgi:hypothetical protein
MPEYKQCEVCKKELKGEFVMVSCEYWDYHPVSECGGRWTSDELLVLVDQKIEAARK